jgi:hypothetical protein
LVDHAACLFDARQITGHRGFRTQYRLHRFVRALRMAGMQHHPMPLRDKQPGGHLPKSIG